MPRRIYTLLLMLWAPSPEPADFHFAILGDRTGEAQPGVYEGVVRAAAADNPAFVVTVGDSIEGLRDGTAEAEWAEWRRMIEPFGAGLFFPAPGNHDIWSDASERLFRKYSRHAPHYSFDSGPVHVTVLDNSRLEELPATELAFLENDLKAHAEQPVKFVISHRPSWIFKVLSRDPDFPLHRLARRYGVQYVIAGHIHQMLHARLEGVEYVSMVSSGGHLRGSGRYEDGWFFGYASVAVKGQMVSFRIHTQDGRVTNLEDWTLSGLAKVR